MYRSSGEVVSRIIDEICACRLPGGNTLISDYRDHTVCEVTPQNEVVWSHKGLKGPLEAQRLANGHTLIASHAMRTVHEVTSQGVVVLRLKLPGECWSACRLANGDTVVGGVNFLICFDAGGKQRWHKTTKVVTCVRSY